MDDTAQPLAAETPVHEQLDDAAAAIRAMRTMTQTRDESGKFAVEETSQEEPGDEPEYDEPETEADDPDEDQSEAVEMPKSWSKDDEDTWRELPPAAQAKIAEREGQRDAAINAKFQEVAYERKAYEAKLQEANASRDKWATDYDLLVSDISIPKPDPRAYGLGTGNYNREAYDIALLEYEQGNEHLTRLRQQREQIRAQQEQEERQTFEAWKQQHEAEYAPKLLAIVPELKDPTKAEATMRELVNYALANGIPEDTFAEGNQPFVTAAQLALLAKARLYDQLSSGSKPAPKRMQPVVKPGVATPRSAQKSVHRQKAMDRLQSENSIEAAAAAMRALRR